MIVAVPMPAPMHSVTRAVLRLRRSSSSSTVPKIIALRVDIGTKFPAAQTSQGKVLLAALPPVDVPEVLARPSRSGLPPYIGRSLDSLMEELTEVRARGWAIADEELAPGVRSIAVPVRDATGTVRAAMNVTVHAAETSREHLLTRVWGYAHADEIESRTVDVHVRRLRAKLGDEGRRIATVKSVGYRFERADEEP